MRTAIVTLLLLASACTTYRDLLDRGHRLYQEHQFARALANWRALEPDVETLSWHDQTRYAYLRGMTDLQLGFDREARHWLAIAKVLDAEHPGGLEEKWRAEVDGALAKLNRDVFGAER